MFDGILTPEFLQAACAHQQSQNVIRLHVKDASGISPVLDMSYMGDVTVSFYLNGELVIYPVDEQYTSLEAPDANTYITIRGDVTRLDLGAPSNGSIDDIICDKSKTLMSLTTPSSIKHLRAGKYLTSLTVKGTGINLVYYPANNNAVSTAIANAITNASANNGTVYTDPNGTYYDTIAQAATAKGWTIEQL